jgi:hypothetical protein
MRTHATPTTGISSGIKDVSEPIPSGLAGGAIRSETGHPAAHRATEWLCLAAAPTFAIMALLTAVLDAGEPDMLCSAAEHASRLSGMIPMYLLMSAFHSPPWLALISSRRGGARRA